MKQLKLFSNQNKNYHGGSLMDGKRKEQRPLCSKRPLHLVLKSTKEINLFKHRSFIEGKINRFSLKWNKGLRPIGSKRSYSPQYKNS